MRQNTAELTHLKDSNGELSSVNSKIDMQT